MFQIYPPVKKCTPVQWEKCELVPYQVDFKVPEVTCRPDKAIPYNTYVNKTEPVMTSHMECEVR